MLGGDNRDAPQSLLIYMLKSVRRSPRARTKVLHIVSRPLRNTRVITVFARDNESY